MTALSPRARRAYTQRRRAGDPAHLAYYRARLEDHPLVPDFELDHHAASDLAAVYTADVDGRTYRVELVHDVDAWQDRGDADCYSEDDLQAARDDYWSFYIVSVTLPGVAGEGYASLGGCEIGPHWPGTDEAQIWTVITEYGLLEEARDNLLATTADVSAELAAPLEVPA